MSRPYFFAGEVITDDGKRVPCVGVREPGAQAGMVPRGASAIDALTTIYGSDLPKVNDRGYAVRTIDEDMCNIQHVAEVLSRVGEVTIMPDMRLEEVVRIVGQDAIKGLRIES